VLVPILGAVAATVLVALVLTAHYGLRLIAYSLFLASVGLLGTLAAVVAAAGWLFTPGILPTQVVSLALFTGPFAAIAVVVGYAIFAASHGRELRQHDDERLLGNMLVVASLLALAAAAWIVQKPRASLITIQTARPAIVDATVTAASELATEVSGGQTSPAKARVNLRTNRRAGAAVDHVNVSLRTPNE
jgi:hypothetical protein